METHMEDEDQWAKSSAQMTYLNNTKAELRRQNRK